MLSQQCPPTTITLLLTTKLTVLQNIAKAMPKHVEKFVEIFVRKWKKMENYSYFCRR